MDVALLTLLLINETADHGAECEQRFVNVRGLLERGAAGLSLFLTLATSKIDQVQAARLHALNASTAFNRLNVESEDRVRTRALVILGSLANLSRGHERKDMANGKERKLGAPVLSTDFHILETFLSRLNDALSEAVDVDTLVEGLAQVERSIVDIEQVSDLLVVNLQK